jgi:hypothetical protein
MGKFCKVQERNWEWDHSAEIYARTARTFLTNEELYSGHKSSGIAYRQNSGNPDSIPRVPFAERAESKRHRSNLSASRLPRFPIPRGTDLSSV